MRTAIHYQILSFLLFLFIVPQWLLAQKTLEKTAIDSTQVRYFNRSFDSLSLAEIHHIDTSLLFFSRFEPLKKGVVATNTLSNAGLAHQEMIFSPVFRNGFDVYQPAYQRYLKNSSTVSYLMPTAPITELNYMMGSKKEQQLGVRFARQLQPRLFIGMDYSLINSPGPYKNSSSNVNGAYFTARYRSKNEKYGVLAHYFFNKLEMAENGGIKNDDDFESNLETDRRVIAVQLVDAANLVKQSGFGLEQEYILAVPRTIQLNDTVKEVRQIGLGRLSHRMEYQRNQLIYSERSPLEAFYQPFDVVLDSTQTFDSAYVATFRNSLQWNNLGYQLLQRDYPFYFYAGVETLNSTIADSTFKRNDWQLNPYGGVRISLLNSFFIDGEAKLITGSVATGDLQLKGGIRQYLGTEERNLGDLFFRLNLINQSASWFYQRYQSNHFRWENDFMSERYLSFHGGYHIKGITLGGSWHVIDKYLYMDRNARPAQTSGTFGLLQLYGNFHLKPGKFDISGNVYYQQSNNDTLIHLPELTARLRVTFTTDIFKKAATIQPGIEVNWFSSYFADAWMPATRSFYLQDEKAVGGYPYIDAHLALKVKRARIFVQYANLFGLTGDYSYFTTPHHPMRDPRFYLGVSWRFYQ